MPPPAPRTALVLSAGGVRGAYQVGVIAGIIDLLGPAATEPLFDIFTGASVGAINASYLAANADRRAHAIDGLVKIWSELDFDQTLQFAPLALWGWPRVRMPGRPRLGASRYAGRSLLDPRPVEDVLTRMIPWDRLHANIRTTLVRGLMIAALDVCDGSTTVFTELASGVSYPPYPYLTSRTLFTAIDAEHVLAATALPFMFPARKIDDRYYMDGAIRFETPIIPALRAGAERVVVIPLLDEPAGSPPRGELVYPGVFFLIGQLLSAVLLDPLLHDVDMLQRNNHLVALLAGNLDPATAKRVIGELEREIPPGRHIPALVLRPSADLEQLTADYLRHELRGPLRRAILGRLTHYEAGQALLASFLFFDGRLAARLIELGFRDAHAQRDRILAFFDDEPCQSGY